jgi:stage II sporulation protein D
MSRTPFSRPDAHRCGRRYLASTVGSASSRAAPTPSLAHRKGEGCRLGRYLVPLLLAACLAAFHGGKQAYAAEGTLFNISGRGWGHGIGMSQWGAYGYALHGWSYGQIIRHYYSGVGLGRVDNPKVRVLLARGLSSVRISSNADFTVRGGSRTARVPAQVVARVTWSSAGYTVTAGTRRWTFGVPVTFAGGRRLRLFDRNQNGWPAGSGGARYRGDLCVGHTVGGLQVVNVVNLEGYLRGVVPREAPAWWPAEALKAQAVAARSYAARSLGSSRDFDVYCTTASQVYNGYDGESSSTNKAVAATAGVVPVYAGRPIIAYFFSCSGGHTENIENVWGGSPVAYLKGVTDPYDGHAPYHVWPEGKIRRSSSDTARRMRGHFSGRLRTIYVVKRGTSPRVVRAYVLGVDGSGHQTASALSGWTLRSLLGLRDSWFQVRTMSVKPSGSATMTYGSRLTVAGRTYPGTPSGRRIALHYKRGGVWRTTNVPSTRALRRSFTISDGAVRYSGRYTAYSFRVHPPRTTVYYFGYGTSRSPSVTVRVRPSITIDQTTGPVAAERPVTLRGSVRPARLAGRTITLQRREGATWKSITEATVQADGSYNAAWAPPVGSHVLRAHYVGGAGLVAGSSDTVALTATTAG